MKQLKLLFLMIFMSGMVSFAQDNGPKPMADDWHEKKWQFMTCKAQLSQDDATKVYPVFMNYERTLWELHKKNREAFKNAMRDKNQKPNFADLNDAYIDFEFKQAQMLKNYHNQLRKLLDPETLFRYYKAEREYKRKLLTDFQDKRPPERPKPQ